MQTKVNRVIVFLSNLAFLILILCFNSISAGCLDGFLKGCCWNNIKYTSEFKWPEQNRQICLDKKKLYNTDLSNIYSGWFSDDENKHRFVIKKYNLMTEDDRQLYKNSVKIFRIINEIPSEAERRLLINAVDWSGRFLPKKNAVIVMELAGKDLYTHLLKNKPDFTEENIRNTIRLLAQPLVVFHREVGIHLDVKPGNYLYDEMGVFLKLNDFDGSHTFPANVPIPSEGGRANVGIRLNFNHLMYSVAYSSPEMYEAIDGCMRMLTTKSDIWSLGMSLYVALLRQKRYGLDNEGYRKMRDFLAEVFREQPLNNPANHRKDLEWLLVNLDSFEIQLKIITEFPETFQLLNNLLNPEPAARMSASGVVNYTNGECRPKVRAEIEAEDDIILFGQVTARNLLNIQLTEGRTTLQKSRLEKLKKLLKKALLSKQQHQSEVIADNNNDDVSELLPECPTD